MLHTPNSTGTILSPDKYMMDNSAVHTFKHEGNKNSTDSINFENQHGTTIAAIDMKRNSDGLWYTTNPVLLPPLQTTNNTAPNELNPSQNITINKASVLTLPTLLDHPDPPGSTLPELISKTTPHCKTRTWTAKTLAPTDGPSISPSTLQHSAGCRRHPQSSTRLPHLQMSILRHGKTPQN